MTDPTPLVQSHIARLFPLEEREEVTHLLREDCGAVLSGTDSAAPELFERVQCAALKQSEGRVEKLYDAIALAQTDWRDLLVCAGFAEDPLANKDWRE
jgi:hypothetical protein